MLLENCEIIFQIVTENLGILPSDTLEFQAVAEIKGRRRVVGRSARFKAGLSNYYGPNSSNRRHAEALKSLKTTLVNDGWEQVGCGKEWFNLKFSRELSGNGGLS
jgi:hypothetical protein